MKKYRSQAHSDHNMKLQRILGSAAGEHEHHPRTSDDGEEGRKKYGQFKNGGAVDGDKVAPRLDRPGRARGGKAKHPHVNVIVAPTMHAAPAAGGAPAPGPGGPPPGAPPPHPPMMMPPPGAAPGGMPGGPPGGMPGGPPGLPPGLPHPPMGPGGMMPRKRGGGVVGLEGKAPTFQLTGGGGHSGVGRLAKAKSYGKPYGEGPLRARGGKIAKIAKEAKEEGESYAHEAGEHEMRKGGKAC